MLDPEHEVGSGHGLLNGADLCSFLEEVGRVRGISELLERNSPQVLASGQRANPIKGFVLL